MIVDGYSVGKYLPAAFQRLGAEVVHLQSTPRFLSSVPPPDLGPYLANVVLSATDPDRTTKELAAYDPCCVLPGQETGVPPVDRTAERLGLPATTPPPPPCAATSTASQANFLWLPLRANSTAFAAFCAQHGVMVRAFPSDGVRVTIGLPEENDAFLRVAGQFTTPQLVDSAVVEPHH